MVEKRYSTFKAPLGQKVANGTTDLSEMFDHCVKTGEPPHMSGQQELYEVVFNEAT